MRSPTSRRRSTTTIQYADKRRHHPDRAARARLHPLAARRRRATRAGVTGGQQRLERTSRVRSCGGSVACISVRERVWPGGMCGGDLGARGGPERRVRVARRVDWRFGPLLRRSPCWRPWCSASSRAPAEADVPVGRYGMGLQTMCSSHVYAHVLPPHAGPENGELKGVRATRVNARPELYSRTQPQRFCNNK